MDSVLILEDNQERIQKFFDAFNDKTNLYIAETAQEAITLLSIIHFDWAFLDHDLGVEVENTGYKVATWLSEHKDRMPSNVVIHSLNPSGARRMNQALPQAEVFPCAWDYL